MHFIIDIIDNDLLKKIESLTINRKNNSFCTSVYRKPTFTALGLRFDSFAPKSYKYNLISCLIHRAYKISSNL